MTDHERKIFRRAINYYKANNQMRQLLEEMSELQKEVCKYLRGRDTVEQIAEEIADVQIMLDQMILIFSCGGKVQAARSFKVHRLAERLNGGDKS